MGVRLRDCRLLGRMVRARLGVRDASLTFDALFRAAPFVLLEDGPDLGGVRPLRPDLVAAPRVRQPVGAAGLRRVVRAGDRARPVRPLGRAARRRRRRRPQRGPRQPGRPPRRPQPPGAAAAGLGLPGPDRGGVPRAGGAAGGGGVVRIGACTDPGSSFFVLHLGGITESTGKEKPCPPPTTHTSESATPTARTASACRSRWRRSTTGSSAIRRSRSGCGRRTGCRSPTSTCRAVRWTGPS